MRHVVQDVGPVTVNALTSLNIKDFGVCYAGFLDHQDFRQKAKMFPSRVTSAVTTPTPQAYPASQSNDHVAIGMPVDSLRYQPPARPAMARNFELETVLPRPRRQIKCPRHAGTAATYGATALALAGGSAVLLYKGIKLARTLHPYQTEPDGEWEVPESEKHTQIIAATELFVGGMLGLVVVGGSVFAGCVRCNV